MGRHELLFRIASGGMAEVYAARSTGAGGFEKLVAIKRMLPTLADDEDFVAMFLDEARMAATIQSPHVVQTLDLGRDETGALYLVMDLVVGAPLSRIMKEAARARRVVPLGMAVELISQAAEGLHAAHEATTASGDPLHIVHRDVSPQNILIGVDGRARITDFGVARAVSRLTKTAAGRVKGKFAYSSPEQLRSNDLDRRADVFALGVVAWELLAGQRLFVAEHPLAVIERVQSMPIVDISTVRPKVPPPISEVVMTALQRDPEQRWQTAHEFAEELREEAVASGIPSPNGTEIGRFVQAAGGESLKKFRSNIRQALSATPVEEESAGAVDFASVSEAEDDPSEVTDDVGVPRTTSKSLDESSVARMPGEVLVSPKAATRPVNWRPVIAGAVGVLLLFGAGAIGYSLARTEPALVPPAAPVATTPTTLDAGATSAIASETAMAAEPTMTAETAETAVEEDAGAAAAASPPRPRRGRPRATPAEPTGASQVAMTPTSMMRAATVSPMAPPSEMSPEPTPASGPSVRRPGSSMLMGLDQFGQ